MSEMGRCRECRFWAHSLGRRFDADPNIGVASALGYSHEWGYCIATISGSATGFDGVPNNPIDATIRMAEVADTEGWLGTLTTRSDFGCVQYTEKEPR